MSSRLRPRANGNLVSLFPFLAVLICTMGTLLLLLIIITQFAKSQQEINLRIMTKSRDTEEMEYETAMAESMTNDLLESKKQTELEIENERAKMAVLEKQIEKLASEIDQTLKFLQQREQTQAGQNQETENLQKQLELKQSELATLDGEYKTLQEQHANGKRSYAIVPYRGPNGTFKRPIYIECTYDKVIIQPEGVVFSEMDFLLADHPDNPLDAGIRAVYQYYLERGQIEHGSEPYPLIVVRPQGIDAYYAVRTAIRSWNDNYGYELVEEDWKLEFPEANPELKNMIASRVEIARLRLQPVIESLMAREMRMQGLGRPNLAQNGMGGGGYGGAGYGASHGSGYSGSSGGGYGGGVLANQGQGIASAYPGGAPGTSFGSSASGYSSNGNEAAPTVAYQNEYATGTGSGAETGYSRMTEMTGGSEGSGGIQQNQGSSSQQATNGASAGEASSMNNLFIRTTHDGESGGESGKITMEQIWGAQQNASQNMAQQAPPNPAYSESFNSTTRRPFQPYSEPESPKTIAKSNSWAPARPGMTPIGRNISLNCYPDKLVFVRSSGKGIDREIPVSYSVQAVSGEFADAVWKYVETWGDAGSNMYWRPTLKVTVNPGAESQFDELKTMLGGSGLKVERAQ